MITFTPSTPDEVLAAVQWAVDRQSPLEILGQGSKRGIGRPANTEHTLDLSGLTGVTLYEPAELVLSARAGTSIAEVEALLAENGQQFAFEPIDLGPLAGAPRGAGTLGGTLAANLAGPRRLKAGAVRDHILGVNCVSGRGDAFKSGGRVVKNVTGYDMSKLMAGSWGTLAVVTDLTFKVLPAAETETTLAVRGLLDEDGVTAMALALGSSAEVSGAAHLPEGIPRVVAGGALGGDAATLLRVEGFGPSVAYRIETLKNLLSNTGSLQEIDAAVSKEIWRDIRDCLPFADGTQKPVWRVSMPPADAHRMVMALRMEIAASAFYDWQGGLVWLRTEDGDPHAETLRRLIKVFGGGHATLIRADVQTRASVSVFEPQPPALAALSQRLKHQFDPQGVLNPGRMG